MTKTIGMTFCLWRSSPITTLPTPPRTSLPSSQIKVITLVWKSPTTQFPLVPLNNWPRVWEMSNGSSASNSRSPVLSMSPVPNPGVLLFCPSLLEIKYGSIRAICRLDALPRNWISSRPVPFPSLRRSLRMLSASGSLSMKRVHNVFHASLLEPAPPDDIPLCTDSPPPPVEYSDHVEFEVAAILDSRVDRRRKDSGVLYLVQWAGFEGTAEEFSWEPVENVSNASAKVREFHRLHPGKPRPEA